MKFHKKSKLNFLLKHSLPFCFQIRIHALVCVGKLVSSFDKWFVQDEVLPFLEKIACKEPGVLMGILGIYKTVLTSDKIGKKSLSCINDGLVVAKLNINSLIECLKTKLHLWFGFALFKS